MVEPEMRNREVIYMNQANRVSVYLGTYKGLSVVLKERIHSSITEANSALHEALHQIKLDHPVICKIYDCTLDTTDTGEIRSVIVMERMNRDLYEEITQRAEKLEYWTEEQLLRMLESLVEGLIFAQSKAVCHRDLKPQNIFVHNSGLKIGDFGSSKTDLESQSSYSIQGSPFFLSPELKLKYLKALNREVENTPYDPYKSDVYSLGVTVMCMALLRMPTELASIQQLKQQTEIVISQCQRYPQLSRILRLMLEIQPENRVDFLQLQMELAGVPPPPVPIVNFPELEICGKCGLYQLPVDSDFPPMSNIREFCVCSRMKVCPNCNQPVPRDAAGELHPCNCSFLCLICETQVQDLTWTRKLPEQFQGMNVCSQVCLEKMCANNSLNCCVWCYQVLDTLSVKLNCDHFFHNLLCLSEYLEVFASQRDPDFDQLSCPKCGVRILPSFLKTYFQTNLMLLPDDMKSVCPTRKPHLCLQLKKTRLCLDCIATPPAFACTLA